MYTPVLIMRKKGGEERLALKFVFRRVMENFVEF